MKYTHTNTHSNIQNEGSETWIISIPMVLSVSNQYKRDRINTPTLLFDFSVVQSLDSANRGQYSERYVL